MKNESTGSCVLTEDQAFEMIAFLASSAEISLHEPIHYGTLRLIDAVSKLTGFMLENGHPVSEAFLRDLKSEIDVKKLWAMWDQPGYYQFLRETPAKVAGEVVRRAECAGEATD